MDLPSAVQEELRARGYEIDGSRSLTGRPDRVAFGLRTASGMPVLGKLYPAGGGETAFANMLALWRSSFGERRDPPGLPRPIEYVDSAGVLVMEHLGGAPLAEADYLEEAAFRASVELLAALHGCDAVLASRPRTARRIVTSLQRKRARIAELAPEHAAAYGAAVDAVEAAQPRDSELVCCHGDFSPRNVVRSPGGRYALVDWDRLRLSDPARDVAHFGAWCWLQALHRRQSDDWSALGRLVALYTRLRPSTALDERLDFHVAAALLRMVYARLALWRDESYLVPRLIEEAARRAG